MCYLTSYDLVVVGGTKPNDNYIREVNEIAGEEKLTELSKSPYAEWVIWYEHDDDMMEMSRRYPELTFVLTGAGENPGDEWKKYYKNGKCKPSNLNED